MLTSLNARSHIIHKPRGVTHAFNILLSYGKTAPDMPDISKDAGIQTKSQNR